MLNIENLLMAEQEVARSAPLPRNYVSMFRIGGVPILPPLMTTEKRLQMQKIKEKAIKLENHLEKRRLRKLNFRDNVDIVLEEHETSRSSINDSSNTDSVSQPPTETELEDQLETMITNMLKIESDVSNIDRLGADNGAKCLTRSEKSLQDRLSKLQKSETLIYDNNSNAIIVPINQLNESELQQINERHELDCEVVNQLSSKPKRAADIETQSNVNQFSEPNGKQIPSIYIDPPTPLGATCQFSDTLSIFESHDSMEIASEITNPLNNRSFSDNFLSSDESITYSESHRKKRPTRSHVDRHDWETTKTTKNLTSRVSNFDIYQKCLEYDELCDDINSVREQHNKKDYFTHSSPSQHTTTCTSLENTKPSKTPLNNPLNNLSGCTINMKSNISRESSPKENLVVRSNSFTLDGPSQALLEHIRQQKAASQRKHNTQSPSYSATRDTIESKAKRVQKVELKPRRPTPVRRNQIKAVCKPTIESVCVVNPSTLYTNNKSMSRQHKRSPYESKVSISNTPRSNNNMPRMPKKSISLTGTSKQIKTKYTPATTSNKHAGSSISASSQFVNGVESPPTPITADYLKQISAEQHEKFVRLIAKQQEEQQNMKEAFELQQKMLLLQLNDEMDNTKIAVLSDDNAIMKNGSKNDGKESRKCVKNVMSTSLNSGNRTTRSYSNMCRTESQVDVSDSNSSFRSSNVTVVNSSRTPRRRLFSNEQMSGTPVAARGGGIKDLNASPSSSTASRRYPPAEANSDRRAAAATTINAYARGFLVRRLFRTEQILQIVQTIKDTLIFVLNLHFETADNSDEANTPANIKLKARLLQQLSSASRTLHFLLFQTSIKERMDIISRDRKRIKTKILTMNMKRAKK